MSTHEEFNAAHKWTDEILGRIKRKKLSRDTGWDLALTDLPTHLKAHVGKLGEHREGSSLKATLQGET